MWSEGVIGIPDAKDKKKHVCNYDRGWDIHPTCKEAEMALCILLENHN